MGSVNDHYDRHLGRIYSWMLGDLDAAMAAASAELHDIGVSKVDSGLAVDLGAGHGVHAVPLAKLGYDVVALDGCATLVEELRVNAVGYSVRAVCDDLHAFPLQINGSVDVIVCMGDTLTHLASADAVESLLQSAHAALNTNGIFAATFRDYVSRPLRDAERFVFVKCDASRILTCFLEYGDDIVTVHDLLHECIDGQWGLKVSCYPKLRLDPKWVQSVAARVGLGASLQTGPRGMVRLVARKR